MSRHTRLDSDPAYLWLRRAGAGPIRSSSSGCRRPTCAPATVPLTRSFVGGPRSGRLATRALRRHTLLLVARMHAWAILGVCAVVVAIATVTGHDPLTTTAVSATVLTALAVALALRVVVAGRRHCRAIHPDGAEIRAGWGPDALRLVSQHGEEVMVYRHLVRLDPLDDRVAVRTAWGAMSVLPRAIADDEALAVVRDHRQVVGAV